MNEPHAREANLFRFAKSCPGANTEIRITGVSVKVKKTESVAKRCSEEHLLRSPVLERTP